MIPVPSYQVLEFFEWLRWHERDDLNLESQRLEALAEEFLWRRGEGPRGFIRGHGLRRILRVFQACPMLEEADILERMRHFAGCGRCLREGPQLRRDQLNPRGPLHPLLEQFMAHAARSGLSAEVDELEPRERGGWGDDDWLRTNIERTGGPLLRDFTEFIEKAPPELVENFIEAARTGVFSRGPRDRRIWEWDSNAQELGMDGRERKWEPQRLALLSHRSGVEVPSSRCLRPRRLD
jgi:hypothetical protein